MPHYYLHQRNDVYVPDEEGDDFADLAEAREKALIGARSIMSEEVKHGSLDFRGVIEIADDSGLVVEVVRYRDAVTVKNDDQAAPR
jgi:hypothetical protein